MEDDAHQYSLLKTTSCIAKTFPPSDDGCSQEQHIFLVGTEPVSFAEWKEAGDKRRNAVQPDDWSKEGVVYGRKRGDYVELFLIHDRFGGLSYPRGLKENMEAKDLIVDFFETKYIRAAHEAPASVTLNYDEVIESAGPILPPPDLRQRSHSVHAALQQSLVPKRRNKTLPWPLSPQTLEALGFETQFKRRKLKSTDIDPMDPTFRPWIKELCVIAVRRAAEMHAYESGIDANCGIIASPGPNARHLILIYISRRAYQNAVEPETCTACGVEYRVIGHFDLKASFREDERPNGQGEGVWFTADISHKWTETFKLKVRSREEQKSGLDAYFVQVDVAVNFQPSLDDELLVEEGAHYVPTILDDLAKEEEEERRQAEKREKTRLKKLAAREKKRSKKGPVEKEG